MEPFTGRNNYTWLDYLIIHGDGLIWNNEVLVESILHISSSSTNSRNCLTKKIYLLRQHANNTCKWDLIGTKIFIDQKSLDLYFVVTKCYFIIS